MREVVDQSNLLPRRLDIRFTCVRDGGFRMIGCSLRVGLCSCVCACFVCMRVFCVYARVG